MSLRNWLRKWFCPRVQRNYKPIRYRATGTSEENSQRLLECLTKDFELVRNRKDAQCLLFGRFMGLVLLLERKLVLLLEGFDPDINERMFGQKIEVFKDFLNEFNWSADLKIESFRALIGPLKEIKNIRDAMAHDLSKVSIDSSELAQTEGYLKSNRQDLHIQLSHITDTETRNLCIVAKFGFVFSDQVAKLQCKIE